MASCGMNGMSAGLSMESILVTESVMPMWFGLTGRTGSL